MNSACFGLNVVVCAGLAVVLIGTSMTAQTITHAPLYTFDGDDSGDQFGSAVSGAGDVNGDGVPDLIVGAASDDVGGFSNIGSFSVFSGATGNQLYRQGGFPVPGTAGFFSGFGRSIAVGSDVNNDGAADIFATDAASLYTISGADGTLIDSRGFNNIDSNFRVSAVGDLNGDGFLEIALGSPGSTNNGINSGYVDVLSGDGTYASLYRVSGNQASQTFGFSIADVGDVNADGTPDLIIGGFGDDTNAVNSGLARVVSGVDGSELQTFFGDTRLEELGASVSGIGDLDNDGVPDLFAGGAGDDVNGDGSGSVTAYSGFDGAEIYSVSGDDAGDALVRVARLGDINQDGVADFAATAILDDNNGNNSGSVRLFSGVDGTAIATFDGDNAGDLLAAVSSAGDINGDGIDDFIVGAQNGGANGGGYARVFVSQISSVPEPGSATVILVTVLVAACRRRCKVTFP